MSKDPTEYLRHIQDECIYIISVSKELNKEDSLKNETLKRAFVRSLEFIGEAKKNPCRYQSRMEYNSVEKYGGNERSLDP